MIINSSTNLITFINLYGHFISVFFKAGSTLYGSKNRKMHKHVWRKYIFFK